MVLFEAEVTPADTCRNKQATDASFKYDDEVLACLASSDRCLSAYEVARALSQIYPERVRAASIYRSLKRLVERGVAKKVVSQNAFVALPHLTPSAGEDFVVVTCSACRKTEVQPAGLTAPLLALARSSGFQPRGAFLEAISTCPHCRDQAVGSRHAR